MKPRRIGCMVFGVGWTIIFLLTNFGLALGNPVDDNALNPLQIVFWIELAVFLVGMAIFIRAEMKDADF